MLKAPGGEGGGESTRGGLSPSVDAFLLHLEHLFGLEFQPV